MASSTCDCKCKCNKTPMEEKKYCKDCKDHYDFAW